MAILASLPGINLFSSFPSTPPPNNASSTASSSSHSPSPPIPVPKYPPPRKSRIPETASPKPSKPSSNPALKLPHRQTHYYKPVKDGVIASDGDRAVLAGESGVSYLLPGAPFEFQYSYTETPKAKPLAIREPAFLPFAPPTMPRPWTGKAPLKKSKKKNIPLFDSFNPPPPGKRGVKYVEKPGPFPFGKYPDEGKTREEILGEPLTKSEIKMLVKPHLHDNRQVNLGRDGLTHNMLELVHTHWKRRRVCKVRCKGVPTVDMDNVCRHLEEKTGGKIIHRVGGVVYIFRGRNYNYRTRPQYPLMIWKPAAPVYPKLIQKAPEGLTEAEADELREKGKSLLPICKLAKNGVYLSLVKDVRDAFEGSALVKIDCKGMEASDYKKLGAKLKELVPCVLLSFDDEQILMWRGRDWKSRYPEASSASRPANVDNANDLEGSGKPDTSTVISSPKMISLWKRAIESSKALLLNEINLGPEDLLKKVEEFEGVSLVPEHSYTALVLSSEDGPGSLTAELGDSENYSEDDIHRDSENYNEDDICRDSQNYSEDNIHRDSQNYSEDDIYRDSQNCSEDEIYSDDEGYESDSFDVVSSSIPFGSLPVDQIAKKLGEERK